MSSREERAEVLTVLTYPSFRVHYGRWVRFPEHVSVEALLGEVRKSPLLLSSVCLIAVRHTTQDLADTLAPTLFEEAKSLLQSSLLTAPQPPCRMKPPTI